MTIRIDGTNTTANPGITGADADTGLQFGTNELKLVTGGTEAVKIDSNQKLTASQGILFGTDTAAVNTLDDYEEGTWTPSFVNGTFTYDTQSGQYTKIGNVITIHALLSWTAKSGTGLLRASFPATAAGTRVAGSIGYVQGLDVTASFRQIVFATSSGEAFNTFFIVGDNASPSNMTVEALSSSGQIQFTVTYTVQ